MSKESKSKVIPAEEACRNIQINCVQVLKAWAAHSDAFAVTVEGNQLTWLVRDLADGRTRTFSATVTAEEIV